MSYTIGQVANMMNVTTSTLRFYDKEGLLPFVERTNGGIRLFSDTDIEWLRIIECLKKAKMPIEDIRTYIDLARKGDGTIKERLEIFIKQKEKLQKELEELKATMKVLDYKVWFYQKADELHSTSEVSNMKEEDIPEEFRETRNMLKKHR